VAKVALRDGLAADATLEKETGQQKMFADKLAA